MAKHGKNIQNCGRGSGIFWITLSHQTEESHKSQVTEKTRYTRKKTL